MPFLQSPLWATLKTILAEAFEHSGPVASSGACCWSLPGSFKIHGDFLGIVCHIEGHEIKGISPGGDSRLWLLYKSNAPFLGWVCKAPLQPQER